MKKQNPVLETLKKMNSTQDEEEKEMSNEQLQNEILKEQLAQLKSMKEDSNKPSLMIYLLLTFFLGGLGVHKIYVGKPVKALLYFGLLFLGISPFLALFDFIKALINKDDFR